MRKFPIISLLLLIVSTAAATPCEELDNAGPTSTGEDMCEEDFEYDKLGCLKPNDKFADHIGKREFGQKCDSNGGEEACLLLTKGTEWGWKDFKYQYRNYVATDCLRRTNLVCHGYHRRCYCSTEDNLGSYYQYDNDRHLCVIRPGFPCENEMDCATGTICSQVWTDDDPEERACACDHRYSETEYLTVNTTHWDNWYCAETEVKPTLAKPSRKVEYGFNSKKIKRLNSDATQIVGNTVCQVLSFIATQTASLLIANNG